MTVYVVIHFDGNEDTVVLVCDDEATAKAIAARMGGDGRVESVQFITSRALE